VIKIGDWNGDFHDDFEQVKRIESARTKKMQKAILSVDREKCSAVIQGSGKEPYVTTLNECSCADYQLRHLPCKHIYALAFELGLMDGLPQYDKKNSGFSPKKEVEWYEQLLEEGSISANTFAKICDAFGIADKVSASFDPRDEIARYKRLYQRGELSADAYVKICSALSKAK